jgi:hypothetical protein
VRRLVPIAVVVLVAPAHAVGRELETWRRDVAPRAHLSFELPPGWRLTDLAGGAAAATSPDSPRGKAVVVAYPSQARSGSFMRVQAKTFPFTRGGKSLRASVVFSGRRAETMAVVKSVWPWPPRPRVVWRRSRSIGSPSAGRLIDAVQLPEHGFRFFTWDPLLKRQPDRPGRRWGSARLVRLVLRVIREYGRDHPHAPRLGVGDLSRRHGGWFGARHVSHQNGLDVDIFFPRLDRRERPPDRPGQIDPQLAQDLVDRFVRAGAIRVFVGPRTGLLGDRRIVQVLGGHDNHLHVRIAR